MSHPLHPYVVIFTYSTVQKFWAFQMFRLLSIWGASDWSCIYSAAWQWPKYSSQKLLSKMTIWIDKRKTVRRRTGPVLMTKPGPTKWWCDLGFHSYYSWHYLWGQPYSLLYLRWIKLLHSTVHVHKRVTTLKTSWSCSRHLNCVLKISFIFLTIFSGV